MSDRPNFRADFARTLPIFGKKKNASTFFRRGAFARVLAASDFSSSG
jgi:hypothetical protein